MYDYDLLEDTLERITSPERAITFLETLGEISERLQHKPELLNPEYCRLLVAVGRILAIHPDNLDTNRLNRLESELKLDLEETRYLCEQLVPLTWRPPSGVRETQAYRQLSNTLKCLSIPHHLIGGDFDPRLLVPYWVQKSIQMYYSQNGYAGLDIAKFLSKMRPSPEENEEIVAQLPPQVKSTNKRKERRIHRRQLISRGYGPH